MRSIIVFVVFLIVCEDAKQKFMGFWIKNHDDLDPLTGLTHLEYGQSLLPQLDTIISQLKEIKSPASSPNLTDLISPILDVASVTRHLMVNGMV